LLDYELSRLPEKYRVAVILADLEGRPRKEVARLLKVPEGTVNSRLAQAKKLLAQRLSRRGVALSGSMLSAAFAAEKATASIPLSLALSTTKAAALFTAGHAAVLATPAAALTQGVFKAMLMTKLKVVIACLMVAAVVGMCGLGYRVTAQAPGGRPTTAVPMQKAPPGTAADKPTTDVEALRREIDMLKQSLQLALEKIKSQDAELRALRGKGKGTTGTSPDKPTTRPGTGRPGADNEEKPEQPAPEDAPKTGRPGQDTKPRP
jgi:hypothetical protein